MGRLTQPSSEPHEEPAVQAQLAQLREDLRLLSDVVEDFMHAAGAETQPSEGGEAPFEPFYPRLEEWVSDYFAPMYARTFTPTERWCATWWDHAEAISRLEALWRSWEVARLDELRGMALWYRDFLDGQLVVLMSPTGPFAACTPDRHAAARPLATTPAPTGYWDDPDEPSEPPMPGDAGPLACTATSHQPRDGGQRDG